LNSAIPPRKDRVPESEVERKLSTFDYTKSTRRVNKKRFKANINMALNAMSSEVEPPRSPSSGFVKNAPPLHYAANTMARGEVAFGKFSCIAIHGRSNM
jgi:hypothetical protein